MADGEEYFFGSGPIPIRATDRLRTSSELVEETEVVNYTYVRIFDLSSSEDLQAYQAVLNKIANGMAAGGIAKYMEDSKKGAWKVLLHWIEPVREDAAMAKRTKLNMKV
jgi:hypothetical protein